MVGGAAYLAGRTGEKLPVDVTAQREALELETSDFFTEKACVNSNNTQWKARNDRGATMIAQSPEVTLAGNPR